MNKLKYLAAILLGIAGLALQQAKADTITLGVGNSAISGFPPPYATANITVAGNGLSATVTFHSVVNSTYAYFMGDGGSVALNVNGSFSLSNLAASNSFSGFHPPVPVNAGAGNDDGFGRFTLRLNTGSGYTTSATTISFTVTNLSGTAWTGVTSGLHPFLLANNHGYFAASHIFVGLLTNLRQGAQGTGFAGNGTSSVPDGGATVMLLGMALGALGMVRHHLTR